MKDKIEIRDEAYRFPEDEWRAKVAALPNATLKLSGYLVGECLVSVVDGQVCVDRADSCVEATAELIDEWRTTESRVRVEGDTFTFGTAGLGLGVVSYRLGEVIQGGYLLHRCDGPYAPAMLPVD